MKSQLQKTDHKNEISMKNWVGSTWVTKSQLWKKSTLLVKVNAKSQLWSTKKSTLGQRKKSTLVNGKSQLWSTKKVNSGQRKKSTVNSGQSQRSTLGLTWQ
jgi:hypothetical protein